MEDDAIKQLMIADPLKYWYEISLYTERILGSQPYYTSVCNDALLVMK